MITWVVKGLPDYYKSAGLKIPPGLTLLVGPNNSGKSTLLRLIATNLKRENRRSGTTPFIPAIGTDPDYMDFENYMPSPKGYTFKDSVLYVGEFVSQIGPKFGIDGDKVYLERGGQSGSASIGRVLRRIIQGNTKLIFTSFNGAYQTKVLKIGWEELNSSGENLAAAVDTIQERERGRYEEWVKYIQRSFPLIKKVYAGSVTTPGEKNIFVDIEGQATSLPLNACGTGVAQCALILYSIMFAPEYSIVLLDEAFQHLHPFAVKTLLETIVEIAGTRTVLAATHDPTAIRSPLIQNVLLIKFNGKESRVELVDSERKLDVLKEIGIDYADLLFTKSILIVEGKSEELILKEAQKCGEFAAEIGVASLNGLRFIESTSKVRKEVLHLTTQVLKTSQEAGQKLSFFVDCDERNAERNAQIKKDVEQTVKVCFYVTKRRTLENYFLEASLILEFIIWWRRTYKAETTVASVQKEDVEPELQAAMEVVAFYSDATLPSTKKERLAKVLPLNVLDRVVSKFVGEGFKYGDHKADYALQMYKLAKERNITALAPYFLEVSEIVGEGKKAG